MIDVQPSTCPFHHTPLDTNGQICADCLIEQRTGIILRPTWMIIQGGEIPPSWERDQLLK